LTLNISPNDLGFFDPTRDGLHSQVVLYSLARVLAERPSLYKATIDDLNSVAYRLAFII